MGMQWGYLGTNTVCFQGIDPQSSHGVFLVGSRHHVLGEMRPNSDYGAASNLPGIMGILGIMGIPGRLYDLAKGGGKFPTSRSSTWNFSLSRLLKTSLMNFPKVS